MTLMKQYNIFCSYSIFRYQCSQSHCFLREEILLFYGSCMKLHLWTTQALAVKNIHIIYLRRNRIADAVLKAGSHFTYIYSTSLNHNNHKLRYNKLILLVVFFFVKIFEKVWIGKGINRMNLCETSFSSLLV